MAYNPFNIFRRNQKALFAVLTVFIMIMFTLQSGVVGGDGLETFTRWIGGARAGTVVCTIDGHKVTERDLDSGGARSLQFRRTIANRFMYNAAWLTTASLREYANQQRPRLSETGTQMADAASGAIGMMDQLNSPQFRNNPQLLQFLLMQVQRAEQLVNMMLDSPNARAEDKDVARAYKTIFNLQNHIRGAGTGEHYFYNAPNKTRRDLIDFMLWEKKADQLGIRFTKDDVKKLIQADFYNFFRSDVEVRKLLQQTPGFTMDACLDALASEFKVRAAQSALLGYNSRYGAASAFVTPYETFEYYRDQTSPAIYEVIAVPAAAFVDQVKGEPSEAEINELFKKYGDDEPNPRKETPGFKTPRQISIAWFGVTGEEPYYKKLAEEQIKVGEALAVASGRLSVPLPGAVGAWATSLVAPTLIKEPAVDAAYSAYVRQFKNVMRNEYSSSSMLTRDILEANWAKPGVAAAAVGAFVGQSAGFGNPATAAAVMLGAPIAYELRARAVVGTPLVTGFIPGPSLLPTIVGASAFSTLSEPKPLPIESQRPELLKSTIEKRAKALAYGERPDPFSFEGPKANAEKGDIERFIEELKKMAEGDRPKDKAAVEKYIAEFLATRGIKGDAVGKSSGPRDEFSIEDDPALAPLVKAQKESVRMAKGAHGGADLYTPFGQSFFWTTRFDAGGARRVPTTTLFQGEPFPPRDRSGLDLGQTHYAYWRTEDIAPQKRNAVTARQDIIKAWKRIKARELAQARANAMADAIRNNPKSDPLALTGVLWDMHEGLRSEIKDPKAAQRATRFTINGVCPLSPAPGGQFGQRGGMMPFMLQETENMPYPTQEMETALLDNRDKPAKTVLVLPDAGKDTYYVATLIRRNLKLPEEFKNDVYSQFGSARQILSQHHREAMTKTRQSVLELLKKEFKYEETEEQKKKLDENVKSGNRNDF